MSAFSVINYKVVLIYSFIVEELCVYFIKDIVLNERFTLIQTKGNFIIEIYFYLSQDCKTDVLFSASRSDETGIAFLSFSNYHLSTFRQNR